jgi:hypothetical protein
MKIRLKDLNTELLTYKDVKINKGTIININYNLFDLEFQTCKTIIRKINNNMLELELLPTEASKTFYTKIVELEHKYNEILKNFTNCRLKSIFNNNLFSLKIPMRNDHPLIKIYDKNSNLVNFYNLKENTEVICLVTSNTLWVNEYGDAFYCLNIKEILITK